MSVMKIVAKYVNKSGKLSHKSYIYLIDTETVALVGPMKYYRYNLGKLFDEKPNGDMLMFYIQNQYGKKNNPIIVEEYSYELDEDITEGTELISIIDAGVYNRIKEERVSEVTPTEFGKVKWDAKVDKTAYMDDNDIYGYVAGGPPGDCVVSLRYDDTVFSNSLGKVGDFAEKYSSVWQDPNKSNCASISSTTLGETICVSSPTYTAVSTCIDDKSYSNCPHYKEKCSEEENDKCSEEGNGNMFNKMFKGIEFGKIVDGSIVMSIYGPAFRTADGGYIAHQGHGDYVDADGFLFDGDDSFCFKMPVSRKAVSIGDIIVHNKKYCRIINCDDKGDFVVEDIMNKEIKTIMSSRSPFGFDFYTKVITFGEDMFKADRDNPFGSMLPMMMLMGDGRKSKDNSMMMAMMMMQNGQTEIDPMMMYFMMNGSTGNDMLPMLMMMQSGAFAPKKRHDSTCGCGCDCESPAKDMTEEEIQNEIL